MSSNAHKKLLPIGSNMNDAAYPFRGPHKLADSVNHGHSGLTKRAPTSIGMRITGSNLVIENVQTPKGVEMECELGVDGGIPRPVSLQNAAALMVPGDGHDYNLIAAVKVSGSSAKHYCKLTFNGSEGASVLRVRAPEGCHPDAVYIVADGRRLRPTAGWFRVPIQSRDCSLVANLPMLEGGPTHRASVAFPTRPRSASAEPRPPSPVMRRGSDAPKVAGPVADPYFFVETVREPAGAAGVSQPLLICTTTGQAIPLTVQGTVAVPHAGAPFRLVLPADSAASGAPPAAVPSALSAAAAAPAAVPEVETRIVAPPPAPAALPVALAAAPVPIPLTAGAVSSPPPPPPPAPAAAAPPALPSFMATAPGFFVELAGEDGSTASGSGVATLPLTHRRAQTVQITVKTAQGVVVVRQKSHVPALQPAPAAVQLREDGSGGLIVAAPNPGSVLRVGGVQQANPAAGAALSRVVPQQVVVEQPNVDGTVAALALDVAAKGAGAAVPVPLGGAAAAPVPAVAAPTPAAAPEKWVTELCTALQKTSPEEQRRLVQAIQPSTLPGMTIVNYVRDQLTRQPPAISFTVSKNGLEAVQCPGCTVTAAVSSDPPRAIPTFGSVQLTAGKPAVLTATSTATQRPVSACRVQMSNLTSEGPNVVSSASAGYSPYGIRAASPGMADAGAADGKADTELVTRLLDSLIRHNATAAPVAAELGGISTAPFSAQGRRVVPLLATCLRSATASGAADAASRVASEQAAAAAAAQAKASVDILFTCGAGYVDNIYSTNPQLHLFAAIDEQPPTVVPQRGRVPAQGALDGDKKPYFIRLTARDPTNGSVVVEKTMTVLGVGAQTTPPPPQVAAAAAATTPLGLLTLEGDAARGAVPTEAQRETTRADTPLSSAAPMPYIDVSLQTAGQDVQARFLCPPHLRIVCDVDGVGGNTGQSDFVTKMPASRFHRVNLSLVDAYGKAVFQQKLDVPAMTSPVWGLAVQHNGLSVDPESGSLATGSVDRAPERALQGNFLSFDASTPHYVYLRKYLNGIHGSCVGEVALRLPGLTLPPELAELTAVLRRRALRQVGDAQAKVELQQLRARCASPAVAELITCILDGWTNSGGGYSAGGESTASRVFFRLTGSD